MKPRNAFIENLQQSHHAVGAASAPEKRRTADMRSQGLGACKVLKEFFSPETLASPERLRAHLAESKQALNKQAEIEVYLDDFVRSGIRTSMR